ncbi:MAG: peptide chain release factor N(5)-glutamine methyltransferase [Phycisphaerales bacterium]
MPPDSPTAAPRAASSQAWTTRRLLDWMTGAFREKRLDSPRLLAELLLAHVIGCERLSLYTQADRPASPEERERLRTLVGRALKHEPVQYLVGEAWFFSLPFTVDRRVLVPRPATETIVEHVLQRVRQDCASLGCGPDGEGLVFADVCTGSGCVAVSVLKNLPMARGVASDLSADALDVARVNAERHHVLERLTLIEGNLLEPVARERSRLAPDGFAFVLSNPPYIPDNEWVAVEPNVKEFEPTMALRGGADGLDLVRPIFAGVHELLRPRGEALVEVAASHASDAKTLAEDALTNARVLKDFEGHERVIVAERS